MAVTSVNAGSEGGIWPDRGPSQSLRWPACVWGLALDCTSCAALGEHPPHPPACPPRLMGISRLGLWVENDSEAKSGLSGGALSVIQTVCCGFGQGVEGIPGEAMGADRGSHVWT